MSAEETLAGLQLVDHHCHGVAAGDLDREAFESFINEGFDLPARGRATSTRRSGWPYGAGVPRARLAAVRDRRHVRRQTARTRCTRGERAVPASEWAQALFLDSGYRSDEILGVRESSARSPASSRGRSFASRTSPKRFGDEPRPRSTRMHSRRRSRPLPGTPWG